MSNPQTTVNNQGIGFVGALTLLFAAAKLFGFSNMSWWWVFSPLWIAALATLAILLLAFLGGLLVFWLDERKKNKLRKHLGQTYSTSYGRKMKKRRY
jgi:fatty acid desaturase